MNVQNHITTAVGTWARGTGMFNQVDMAGLRLKRTKRVEIFVSSSVNSRHQSVAHLEKKCQKPENKIYQPSATCLGNTRKNVQIGGMLVATSDIGELLAEVMASII